MSNLASDVPKCKKGDAECIVKSANIMLGAYAKGQFIFFYYKTE